jgi:hypothetical protein
MVACCVRRPVVKDAAPDDGPEHGPETWQIVMCGAAAAAVAWILVILCWGARRLSQQGHKKPASDDDASADYEPVEKVDDSVDLGASVPPPPQK